MKRITILCAAMIVSTFQLAQADVITQYDRATFATALVNGTVSGQNFDSLANGAILTTLNGVTYSASVGNPLVTNAYLTTTPPNGLGSTSAGFFQSTESATISFAAPVTAFGIDVNTFAPTPGDFEATLNTGAVAVSNFDVFPGNATGQFIGFTDNAPFTSVTIQSLTDPGNGFPYTYTLDSLVYGNAVAIAVAPAPVPEPAALYLLLSGFLLFSQFVKKP